MPPYFVPIIIVAIVMSSVTVISIAGMITRTIRSRSKARQIGGGDSLTKSELRALLTDVVSEATDPLYAKVSAMERRLEQMRPELPPAEALEPLQLEGREPER
ncbi:MAG TPA: hypothetical protein VFG50_01780 [Rhodothermales bacterium]|nr:hypothetical protein [Rhodothermales bacterium]